MTLPQQMLIRRYNNEDSLLYALINLHDSAGELTFSTQKRSVPDPVFYKRAVWRPQPLIRRTCVRYGRERKEYVSEFMYTGFTVNIGPIDIEIWEINNPYKVLTLEFMFLNKYEAYQHVVLQGELAVTAEAPTLVPPRRNAVAALTAVQKRLVAFCESNRDSCCPITMEEFSERTVCLTPCGHGIRHSAMLEWLQTRQQCPMCRAACTARDLITWV